LHSLALLSDHPHDHLRLAAATRPALLLAGEHQLVRSASKLTLSTAPALDAVELGDDLAVAG